MADDKLTKLRKLYQALRENQARSYELLEEFGRVLDGDPGVAEHMKHLERRWNALWEARYRVPYMWVYAKDRAQWKRLLAGGLTVADLEARVVAYIKSNDPFYVTRRHPFGIFVSVVNTLAAAAPEELELSAPAPSDCSHEPRCKSDQEHTRRRSLEVRA